MDTCTYSFVTIPSSFLYILNQRQVIEGRAGKVLLALWCMIMSLSSVWLYVHSALVNAITFSGILVSPIHLVATSSTCRSGPNSKKLKSPQKWQRQLRYCPCSLLGLLSVLMTPKIIINFHPSTTLPFVTISVSPSTVNIL